MLTCFIVVSYNKGEAIIVGFFIQECNMAQDIFKQYQVSFKKDEYVFKDGDLGTDMFIIKSGSISVEKDFGGKVRQLAMFGKGDFFGEMSLLENEPRSASVRCLEDCEMVRINSATFDEMIRANIEIAVRMLRKLSHRLRQADEKIEKLMNSDLSGEAKRIVEEVETAQDPDKVTNGDAIAVFISEASGREFPVYKQDVLLGRTDPVTNIKPEVNLSDEANSKLVSRRHARMIFQDGTYYISEEIGALNGTFVDGERLKPGIPTPLAHGSQVVLGMITLIFQIK